jgi:hypothetical protein
MQDLVEKTFIILIKQQLFRIGNLLNWEVNSCSRLFVTIFLLQNVHKHILIW